MRMLSFIFVRELFDKEAEAYDVIVIEEKAKSYFASVNQLKNACRWKFGKMLGK